MAVRQPLALADQGPGSQACFNHRSVGELARAQWISRGEVRRPHLAEAVVPVEVEALEVGAVTTRRGALAVAVPVKVTRVEKQRAADRGHGRRGVRGSCTGGEARRDTTEQGGESHRVSWRLAGREPSRWPLTVVP